MRYLITQGDLERRGTGDRGSVTHRFHGSAHGLGTVSLMLENLQPGDGPALHRHRYEEVFVLQEGHGAYTIAGTTVEAGAGDLVLIPAGVPHRFINSGDGPLRQISIHAAGEIAIEWLDGEDRPRGSGSNNASYPASSLP